MCQSKAARVLGHRSWGAGAARRDGERGRCACAHERTGVGSGAMGGAGTWVLPAHASHACRAHSPRRAMRRGTPPGRVRGPAQAPAARQTGRGWGREGGTGREQPHPSGPPPHEAPRPADPAGSGSGLRGTRPRCPGGRLISTELLSSQASFQTLCPPAPGPGAASLSLQPPGRARSHGRTSPQAGWGRLSSPWGAMCFCSRKEGRCRQREPAGPRAWPGRPPASETSQLTSHILAERIRHSTFQSHPERIAVRNCFP